MNKFLFLLAIACSVLLFPATTHAAESLDLSGEWRVRLDRENQGEAQGWAAKPLENAQAAKLPGSLTTSGIGDDITLKTPWLGSGIERTGFFTDPRYAPYRQPGQIKFPFWLQPDKYYSGKAWYQREITVPADWHGKAVSLFLERCHWSSTAWIDGRKVGSSESLAIPHRYDLGSLAPGKHLLSVCVDNHYLIRVGPDASSVTDHTQGNWNGIIGRIELSAHAPVTIASQQLYPQNDGTVQIRLDLHNRGTPVAESAIRVEIIEKCTGAKVGEVARTVPVSAGDSTVTLDLKLDQPPRLWSEFATNLYIATATVGTETVAKTFGFREIRAEGRTFLVNGVPTFMRGNLDCAAFPLTGHPSMDVADWIRIFKVYKAYGLNHVRFHSWCPPEAAFAAADQEGLYLQVECGVWRGTCPFKTAKPVEPFLYDEGKRICREYGNHPSFVLFTHGNEPWELDKKMLADQWVPAMKKFDPRHLVCASSHYIISPNNDFHNCGPGGGMNLRYHGQYNAPPTTASSYEAIINRQNKPVISHEPGEWCAFPNLKEIPKYTGVLKAKNFETFRDFMAHSHLLEQADDFLMASGKFQTLLYQEETEKLLRTRGLGGFQMLGLNDFPGQGTALVGVVDVFWDAKPYVTAAEYKRFSGPVVPLALMAKRTWTTAETFTAKIRIAQYSGAPLKDVTPVWTITNAQGKEIAAGKLPAGTIPVGNSTELGDIALPLSGITAADRLTLTVAIPGTEYRNAWNFWVYPAHSAAPAADSAAVCNTLADALAKLRDGAAVLLLPAPGQVPGNTVGTFEPVFWNKAWFPGQKEHTLGLLIQDQHPSLAGFPTAYHADWQWSDLMTRSKPMILDQLPPELRPIVQPIDDWNSSRRLGTLLEAKVGAGRLLLCTMDVQSDLDKRPVARQLLASLRAYMNTPAFAPKVELTAQQLGTVIRSGGAAQEKIKITASSAHQAHPAANAVDGDPDTLWHSDWTVKRADYPYTLTLELDQAATVSGVNFLPRQDGNPNGRVKTATFETSADGKAWSTAVAAAALRDNTEWQAVNFPAPAKAKFIRIILLTPQNAKQSFASLAEITLNKE